MSNENWKKGKAESAMIEYEKRQMAKAKEEFKKRKMGRDLPQELRSIGLTHEQCSQVLNWTETLPIQIMHTNTTVDIKQGVIRVWDNSKSKEFPNE